MAKLMRILNGIRRSLSSVPPPPEDPEDDEDEEISKVKKKKPSPRKDITGSFKTAFKEMEENVKKAGAVREVSDGLRDESAKLRHLLRTAKDGG